MKPIAIYIGEMDLRPHYPPFKLFNLLVDLKGESGEIVHPIESTVSENTINKYFSGISVPVDLKKDDVIGVN